MTDKQQDTLNDISVADMCAIISSREQACKDEIRRLRKANEWHKVTDGDLPDNLRYVWTNVGAGYHDDDGWWDDHGRLQGVVAWCEPKFKEE